MPSEDVSRRDFTKQSIGALLTYALLETLYDRDAFAEKIKPVTLKWVSEVNELGRDMKNQKVSQVAWQKKIEALFSKVELAELLQLVDFERLAKNAKLADNGARSLRFKFPEVEGLPKKYVFGRQIFGLKKGRSVVPHGHNNMSTAFMVLSGTFQGKHYDRLEDRKDDILIKPTIDRKFKPSEFSTVSDYKDNVHWFKALDEPAFLFNIHVLGVRPGSKLKTGRVYLDPNGEKLKGGVIRAKRLGYKEAHKLYG